jgi:MFS family permease
MNTNLLELIISFLLLGISISMINTGSMTAALENIPTTKAGIASGTIFTIRWLAGSIGVVLLSLLFQLEGLSIACFALAIIAMIGLILANQLNKKNILLN